MANCQTAKLKTLPKFSMVTVLIFAGSWPAPPAMLYMYIHTFQEVVQHSLPFTYIFQEVGQEVDSVTTGLSCMFLFHVMYRYSSILCCKPANSSLVLIGILYMMFSFVHPVAHHPGQLITLSHLLLLLPIHQSQSLEQMESS